jgi:hypothetical protein
MNDTIYVVAQDEQRYQNGQPFIETRIAYNLGAWKTEALAQKVADKHNAQRDEGASANDEDQTEGEYYVLPIAIQD